MLTRTVSPGHHTAICHVRAAAIPSFVSMRYPGMPMGHLVLGVTCLGGLSFKPWNAIMAPPRALAMVAPHGGSPDCVHPSCLCGPSFFACHRSFETTFVK